MDFGRIYEFVVEMLTAWDSHRVAAFIVGTLFGLVLASIFVGILIKIWGNRHVPESTKAQDLLNQKLQTDNDRLAKENLALESNQELLRERAENTKAQLDAKKQEVDSLKMQANGWSVQCKRRDESIRHLQEAKKEADLRCQGEAKQCNQLRNDVHTLKLAIQKLQTDRQVRDNNLKILKQQVSQLSAECERLREDCVDIASERDHETGKLTEVLADLERCQAEIAELKEEVADYAKDFNRVANSDGKVWEEKVTFQLTPKPHSVPVISILNLKGGVGKTTVTACLGSSLVQQGHRVLLVDLDYQGSLTALCLTPAQVQDHVLGNRLVHQLFTKEFRGADSLWKIVAPLGKDTRSYIVPANDKLADAEMRVMSRWLLNGEDEDMRFALRQTLHDATLQARFDFILLDCPPRLTTACVNALAASDYVLIPTLLDKTSADAVPRLLIWLKELIKKTGIDLSILGVLANRAKYQGPALVSYQKEVWRTLPNNCQDAWGHPVPHFKTLVTQEGTIADAAYATRFTIGNAKLEAIFKDITTEMIRRSSHHESHRTAAVH